ncbi:calcineurin B-like protein 7 isoform X1 [Amaranthus tricolor]|uniref:calcineurin B-like protein 7 isoform X1 n=1 Tax=Amaranthus tricolor TaxID=29722 RepID=UPI0025849ACF|nr:calcineurin B-like protein 7 isoform X1 [Amaranthus tricolor]XP_057520566.1 calcineurin B-like protein 7 isoform X1 [Amaranthus tricolor]XP_057520568.1 calcineurin B-like protein 7 isoform X1 [Amaranthus tricolor]XP_057520569.1 calcineurin B-like protein 7 isoform X1 [Amaranthus tricolor]
MGCMYSKSNNEKILEYCNCAILASETSFSVNEVEALHVLYRRLSSSVVGEGLINKKEFQRALLGNCKQQNLFVDRVFNLFDLKNNGVISFEDFVRSLSIFHPSTPEADKIAFAFNFFDVRNTGYIEREELKKLLLAIFEELNVTLSDNLVEAILEKTFAEVDLKNDGKIDVEEWKEFMSRNSFLMKNMTLPYLKELTTSFPSFFINSEVHDSVLRVKDVCSSNGSSSSKNQYNQYLTQLM